MRHHGLLLLLLLFAMLLLQTPTAHAVETLFEHRFRFERADDTDAAAFANASQAMQGVSFGGTGGGLFTRWNTRTVVAQFGMEAGGRVDVDVRELASLSPSQQHVPLVFTLYDNDQWRVYSVLQLREIPLRSPAILCHYPSSMRFAVTTGSDTEQKKGKRKVSFVVPKASLYTLQMQVCGDASVYVKGFARMVNVGFDSRLSEHLGVEQLGLIPLYKVELFAYTLFTLLWVLECFLRKRNVPRISFAFQVALHVKSIEATLN
ncbi:hypothetical protein Gpo141_00014513, partial [Globisporangium polare]